jgi:hypothetical protein
MGSSSSVNQISLLKNATVDDIAEYVGNIGPAYQEYQQVLRDSGIDGAVLLDLQREDIKDFLSELGIKSVVHKTKLSSVLGKLVEMATASKSATSLEQLDDEKEEDLSKLTSKIEFFIFGSELEFLDGLTKKIKVLTRSMEEECSQNEGGKWWKHFNYVINEAALELTLDPAFPHRIRDQGHSGMRLRDFMSHETAVNASLMESEVAALRLYTGPLYVPWNSALRFYQENPSLLTSWATCISVLYSAVLKLSLKSKRATVYRGVNESDRVLPKSFFEAEKDGDFAGGVELAFMSTTLERDVALEYSSRGKLKKCSIFQIEFDAASRAASVQWVSQYPYENEQIYPPCTFLTCKKVLESVEGLPKGVRMIQVQATVSTMRHKVEDIVTVKDRGEASATKLAETSNWKTLKASGYSLETLVDVYSIDVVADSTLTVEEIASLL